MATTNYGWETPVVFGSGGVWGTILNAALEAIDAALFAVSGRVTALEDTALSVGTFAARPAEPTTEGERYWARDTDQLFVGEDNAGVLSWVEVGALTSLFYAKVYRTTNLAANSTPTAIDFDAESFDSDSVHDTATNPSRLTVPAGVTGTALVLLSFAVPEITVDGTANLSPSVTLRKNGVTALLEVHGPTLTDSGDTEGPLCGTVVDTAVAGDYYELVWETSAPSGSEAVGGASGIQFSIAQLATSA